MVSSIPFGETFSAWAAGERSVRGLALIGSRERAAGDAVWKADAESDWDFYVITSQPRLFATAAWTRGLAIPPPLAYVSRRTADSRAPKVNALFEGAEVDLVVIPAHLLTLGKLMVSAGLHRREGWLRRNLQALAEVIRPGWRFLKGGSEWDPFFRRIVAEVPDSRLSDADAVRLADGLACDYVWIRRKLVRGELRAAQRMLHREVAETNFKLLHELKLRRGERSFEKGRRIERIATQEELAQTTVSAPCDASALGAALDGSVRSCRDLMRQLIGAAWEWPRLD